MTGGQDGLHRDGGEVVLEGVVFVLILYLCRFVQGDFKGGDKAINPLSMPFKDGLRLVNFQVVQDDPKFWNGFLEEGLEPAWRLARQAGWSWRGALELILELLAHG